MTFEHKLVVGLEEIKAVIFQCRHEDCTAKITLAPEQIQRPPNSCPKGHAWDWSIPEEYEAVTGSAFVFFLRALRRLRDPVFEKAAGFKILIEFDEPMQPSVCRKSEPER
jgi:hypothetical protein